MTKREPRYCPYCGTELVPESFEGRERQFCRRCQEYVFQNPVPVARVAVLDGDSALFVRRARPPYQGAWTIPGGVLEVDEPAALGAARELREETGLRTAAEDVELVYTDLDVDDPDDGSILTICFAAERDRTAGTPQAGDEPAAVEFWNPTTTGRERRADPVGRSPVSRGRIRADPGRRTRVRPAVLTTGVGGWAPRQGDGIRWGPLAVDDEAAGRRRATQEAPPRGQVRFSETGDDILVRRGAGFDTQQLLTTRKGV